jgi:hypothetical protein
VRYLGDNSKVPRSSITGSMSGSAGCSLEDDRAFLDAVKQSFGALSGYVHPSERALALSAFDTLPEREFAQLAPGLRALYAKAGWMTRLWAVLLLPLGFAILAVALLAAGALPAWQGIALLAGSLLLMVPDGLELVDLAGCAVLAVAMLPTGVELLGG